MATRASLLKQKVVRFLTFLIDSHKAQESHAQMLRNELSLLQSVPENLLFSRIQMICLANLRSAEILLDDALPDKDCFQLVLLEQKRAFDNLIKETRQLILEQKHSSDEVPLESPTPVEEPAQEEDEDIVCEELDDRPETVFEELLKTLDECPVEMLAKSRAYLRCFFELTLDDLTKAFEHKEKVDNLMRSGNFHLCFPSGVGEITPTQ